MRACNLRKIFPTLGFWKSVGFMSVAVTVAFSTTAYGLTYNLYWMAGCTCFSGNVAIVGFSPIADNNALKRTAARCVGATPDQIRIVVNYGGREGVMGFDGRIIPCPQ